MSTYAHSRRAVHRQRSRDYVLGVWSRGDNPFCDRGRCGVMTYVDAALLSFAVNKFEIQMDIINAAVSNGCTVLLEQHPHFYRWMNRDGPCKNKLLLRIAVELGNDDFQRAATAMDATDLASVLTIASKRQCIKRVGTDPASMLAFAAAAGRSCLESTARAIGEPAPHIAQDALVHTITMQDAAAVALVVGRWPNTATTNLMYYERECYALHIALIVCAGVDVVEVLCTHGRPALASFSAKCHGPVRCEPYCERTAKMIRCQYATTDLNAIDIAILNCNTVGGVRSALVVLAAATVCQLAFPPFHAVVCRPKRNGTPVRRLSADWFHIFLASKSWTARWTSAHAALYSILESIATTPPARTPAKALPLVQVHELHSPNPWMGYNVVTPCMHRVTMLNVDADSVFALGCRTASDAVTLGMVTTHLADPDAMLQHALIAGHGETARRIMSLHTVRLTGMHALAAVRGVVPQYSVYRAGLPFEFACEIVQTVGHVGMLTPGASASARARLVMQCIAAANRAPVCLLQTLLWALTPHTKTGHAAVTALTCSTLADVLTHTSELASVLHFIELVCYVMFCTTYTTHRLSALERRFVPDGRNIRHNDTFCRSFMTTVFASVRDSPTASFWTCLHHRGMPREMRELVHHILLAVVACELRGAIVDDAADVPPPEVWEIIVGFLRIKDIALVAMRSLHAAPFAMNYTGHAHRRLTLRD